MGVDILGNVSEDKRFNLANGISIANIPELYQVLKVLPNEVFSQHVNENKNDFYNWVRDVHQDSKLADDLLECGTKEAMLFCLKSNIERAENLLVLNEIPKENVLERFKNEVVKKPLVTMLEPSVLKKAKNEVVKKPLMSMLDFPILEKKVSKVNVKVKNKSNISAVFDNEKINKSQIKRIRSESADQIINKLKEVFKVE